MVRRVNLRASRATRRGPRHPARARASRRPCRSRSSRRSCRSASRRRFRDQFGDVRQLASTWAARRRGGPGTVNCVRIESADVLVTSPGRNFVTLRITTDDGLVGLGDATLNGRELAVVAYLRDHVVPLLIGRDPHRDRGHLAVPLPRRVLAARSGHDGRDRRGRHGAVGHQGQGRRHAALPAARRGEPHRVPGLRARQRAGPAGAVRLDPGATWSRATGRSACRPAFPGWTRSTASRPTRRRRRCATTTSRRGGRRCRSRRTGTRRAYLRHVPTVFEAVRNEFGPELPLLHDAHHRLTPDPGRAAGQGAGAVRPVLAGGLHARPRTRRRCGWCASTPPPRSRSARSSTPSGTTRR